MVKHCRSRKDKYVVHLLFTRRKQHKASYIIKIIYLRSSLLLSYLERKTNTLLSCNKKRILGTQYLTKLISCICKIAWDLGLTRNDFKCENEQQCNMQPNLIYCHYWTRNLILRKQQHRPGIYVYTL